MTAPSPMVDEMQTALADMPQERRARVLQRLTEAFIQTAAALKETHIEVFDEVMCSLMTEIETQALTELGLRLAPMRQAPHEVVRRLADNPDITVAGPLLTQSERLTPTDLATIAAKRDQSHLLAISGRKHVAAPVTDVLVQRGNAEVVRRLAGNAGAAFSEKGLGVLVERAAGDAAAAEKIVQRADIKPEHMKGLITRATEAVRARLVGAAPPQRRAAVERLIAKITEEIAATPASDEHYFTLTVARLKDQRGKLSEKDVLEFAATKKTGEAIAALSIVTAIPPEQIETMIEGERLEPFLMMCKAANFQWPTVRALLELRRRPVKSMQDFLTSACDDFSNISEIVAQQAMKLWRTKNAG